MSGGGGSTNYPAPILAGLWQHTNDAFQPIGYPQTTGAVGNAYTDIVNQTTNAGNAYNAAGSLNAGSNLTGLGSNLASLAPGVLNYGQLQGQSALNTGLGLGLQAGNMAQGLGGSALGQFAPYIQPALQQGFDPQSALFNYLYGQQQNQGNAVNAQSGVGNTPYGAGLQNQNLQNFDLNWQNQQLQRQNTAANTAGTLGQAGYGTALGALGTGAGALSSLYGTGLSGLANLFGTGVQGAGSLLGQGANAAAQGTAIGQSVPAFQNQLLQQQLQNYLAYAAQNTANSAAWNQAVIGDYGAANQQYGIQNETALAKSKQGLGGLSGLGSLVGGLGSIFTGGLSGIGGALGGVLGGGLDLGGLGADATLGANILGGY